MHKDGLQTVVIVSQPNDGRYKAAEQAYNEEIEQICRMELGYSIERLW